MLVIIVWVAIWLAALALLWWILYRYATTQTRLDIYVVIASSVLMAGLVPGLLTGILERTSHYSGISDSDREMMIHLVSTLSSCITLTVYGFQLIYLGMGIGKVPEWVRWSVILYAVCGAVVIIMAVVHPDSFVGGNAYKEKAMLTWIWPQIVNAPISYVRLVIAGLVIFLPVLREKVKPGRESPAEGQAASVGERKGVVDAK
jgi:hypothetical protein